MAPTLAQNRLSLKKTRQLKNVVGEIEKQLMEIEGAEKITKSSEIDDLDQIEEIS